MQFPWGIILYRLHEGISDKHRQIKHTQAARVLFGFDKGFYIGVVAAQGRHHGAAPMARRHDGTAHGVPDIHEGQGTGGIGAHPFDPRAIGPQGGEVIADAAALLHGQRGFS